MAGTLFSLGLSQRLDSQGNPLIDAPLYIYDANTSTPVEVFQDFGLSVLHPWPLRTDSAGMIPAFWLEDGNYRARFTDAAGAVTYFDIKNMQAVGPSSGEGGEGGDGVDQNAIFQTGDPIWIPRTGVRAGWVRANGRTIGSASSGASERANADTQPLYEYLWNNFSNDLCPVTGGRGANAALDFASNKPIAIYTMRGKGAVGLDDMGNSAAGVLVDGTPTEISYGGAEKTSITIAEANLPNKALSVTGSAIGGNHNHPTRVNGGSSTGVQASGGIALRSSDAADYGPNGGALGNEPGKQLGMSGSLTLTLSNAVTASLNGGVAQTSMTPNTMSPYMTGTWYVRL